MALAEFPRHRFTVEEYHRMGDVGLLDPHERVELIEGEIVDMSPIGRLHVVTVDRLTRLLTSAFGHTAVVRIQQPIGLSRFSEPEPDVSVLPPRDDFYLEADPAPGDVLLVVEVAHSSLRYDRSVKVPLYARSGVRRTWLVDVVARSVHVFTDPSPQGYATEAVVDASGVVEVGGHRIAVADILGPPAAAGGRDPV